MSQAQFPGALQALHAPIDERIVNLLLAMMPDAWTSMVLEVGPVQARPGAHLSFPLTICNAEGQEYLQCPPDRLYSLLFEHYDVFEKNAQPWKGLRVTLTWQQEGPEWRWVITYSY